MTEKNRLQPTSKSKVTSKWWFVGLPRKMFRKHYIASFNSNFNQIVIAKTHPFTQKVVNLFLQTTGKYESSAL